jgi:hypothetical protein
MKEAQRFDGLLRWLICRLRLLLDAADERVHAWEVLLRKEFPYGEAVTAANATRGKVGLALERVANQGESCDRNMKTPSVQLLQPRSRVGNPASRRKRRGMTAAAFDLRFSGQTQTK